MNLPDWLALTVAIDDGDWITPDTCEILEHGQELDLLRGVLTRRFRLRDPLGREVSGVERRFAHMADAHLAGETLAIRCRAGRAACGSDPRERHGAQRWGRAVPEVVRAAPDRTTPTVGDGNLMVAATIAVRSPDGRRHPDRCRPQRSPGRRVDHADRFGLRVRRGRRPRPPETSTVEKVATISPRGTMRRPNPSQEAAAGTNGQTRSISCTSATSRVAPLWQRFEISRTVNERAHLRCD